MNRKNSRIKYYIESFTMLYVPKFLLEWRRKRLLRNIEKRSDYDLLKARVDYCCNIPSLSGEEKKRWMEQSVALKDQKIVRPKVYFLDSYRYARYFDGNNRWILCPGDVNYEPELPCIVKSRPVDGSGSNGVLMKLDKVRHFLFLKDPIPWCEKQDKVIFRGVIGQNNSDEIKQNRYDFMVKYFNHPMCDLGEVAHKGHLVNEQWGKPKMSLDDHLKYKFIMALEGNDVATNLKWVMSTNCLAVMPRPTCETWFMEGTLIPNHHYVEIAPDFSDLEERLTYYINHPDEAEAIIRNANEYVRQFMNPRTEELVSLMVLDKYFNSTK